ncbi:hypothetical protein ACI2K4_00815 [Micromonospora sp. NPDC050397]|uniref:hypothetical protein n=1 Tax=Micromonospora sp. NPDC050397 TaxID=3364279 RepID=UPI0038513D9B
MKVERIPALRRHVALVLAPVLVVASALAARATLASADPAPVTSYRQLAGVGSDTGQDVMNHLGKVIGNGTVIASWDARPSGTTIRTKASGPNGDCAMFRPNGSVTGRTALELAQSVSQPTYGCVDFARSYNYPDRVNPRGTGTYTYIPFAVDAMTVAINTNSDLPTSYSLNLLRHIYQCLTTDIAGVPVTPLLPRAGTGARQFWLHTMGISEQELVYGDYPCVQDLNHTLQPNDGTALNGHNDYVLPYSVAQWISQGRNGQQVGGEQVVIEDRRGQSILASVGGVNPRNGDGTLNVNFPIRTDVYNVVPRAKLTAGSIVSNTFSGPNSSVCQQSTVIQAYGFGFRTAASPDLLAQPCGSTALAY